MVAFAALAKGAKMGQSFRSSYGSGKGGGGGGGNMLMKIVPWIFGFIVLAVIIFFLMQVIQRSIESTEDSDFFDD
jgi:uncharacterized membrane protein